MVENKLSKDAQEKMEQLLNCGNERVELAAAKEIISALSKNNEDSKADINLEVTIKVI